MQRTFTGRCQCGHVSYKVSGTPLTLFTCHCTECQRQSASAFGMALWVRDYALEISNRVSEWIRTAPSGRQMLCQFCPTCGSRLFHRPLPQTNLLSIKPGTLDDTRTLRPAAHIWRKSAQFWFALDSRCLVYDANPESFDAMIGAWNAAQNEADASSEASDAAHD